MTNQLTISKEQGSSLAFSTTIVASSSYVEPLHGQMMDRFGREFAICPLAPASPIPAGELANVDLLVVEINPNEPESLARISRIKQDRPDILLIAAINEMDVATVRTLIRRGVNDVVSLPFDTEELFASIMDLGSTRTHTDADLCPMIGVLHSSGGCGATTIATHLVAAMADARPDLRYCIIDLDLQFGEVASLFGLDPVTNVVDLISAGDRLDRDILRDSALAFGPNVFAISAPSDITPPEMVDTDRLLRLLTMARKEFDFVLLDLPSDWTSWALSAACSCDQLLMVVEQTIRCLRRTKKSLGLLESVEFAPADVKIVVNRVEKRMFKVIGTDEVSDTLHREVIASIPLQKSNLQTAQDEAMLLGQVDSRAPFVRAIESLAAEFFPKDHEACS
ncbi:AAA family ATPase [Pontixanthobacter gangjinensis]|uniref:AAA domain-containing protein n=1 Tax=Pontixanthobacter gangjinensis TaxID=1028742 RepID=A0A6I4SJH0_9SPHN|nr:AAA family ATPase [Pontixanthobacter gangjinensis]MXO55260.1 hypothetical protein [Pontixanthobacter gangjinensis]